MARPLRIQYPDAWYHVMNRGRRREKIFRVKKDYQTFLRILGEAAEMFHVNVTAYCLMPNHYHLQIQTPQANIARFMRHLDGLYTQQFNRRHDHDGQLFRGRYKALLIGGETYRLEVFRYIHWNPRKAGLEKDFGGYRWSSYGIYCAQSLDTTPSWVTRDLILDLFKGSRKKQLTALSLYLAHEPAEEIDSYFSDEKRRPLSILGDATFITWVKSLVFTTGIEREKPESRLLTPEISMIKAAITEFYTVDERSLLKSRRGITNEPRDMAVYLARHVRGDSLHEIASHFSFSTYSSVSSAIQRVVRRLTTRSVKKQYDQLLKALHAKIIKGQKET